MNNRKPRTALVTGSAGFIGYFVSRRLLDEGWKVIGIDCLSNYYDVALKLTRESMLLDYKNFRSVRGKVEDSGLLMSIFEEERPNIVLHLAAQAGVRYSIEYPRMYLENNICGTFEILEAARAFPPDHMLLASTSSVYGANEHMPYQENQKADFQMSFYAATKKSIESMAHSYSHLFSLPTTICRFFTVYGPWGRPDMALFKFTKAILEGTNIDVYNYGNMERDFTYIEDLVHAIRLLIDCRPESFNQPISRKTESLSPIAPFRIVNIGSSKPIKLINFIEAIESTTGKKAKKNMLPMQPGDVSETWASSKLLYDLTGYCPETKVKTGVKTFVEWFRHYYKL